jgi:hypothetical protein
LGAVSGEAEPIVGRVAAAPARTVAAGTARLSSAWCAASPVPEAQDQRCEGVADLAGRRARVWEASLSERQAAEFSERRDEDGLRRALSEPRETIYDGANAYTRVAGRWTGFFLGDREGPRAAGDPLWPLDALFGARDDALEIGHETVRGVAAARCRLTVDLARADAAVPAGVSVPAGPYRALRQMPAEVWLDAGGPVRRVAVSLESMAGTDDGQNWVIVELWDFGVAADITPPHPEEVAAPREVDWDTPGSGA